MSSEVLQQRDLLVAERTDFLAKCGDKAEYCVVLPQWHYKQCADAADFKDTLNLRWQLAVTIVGPGIGEVDDALSTHEAGQQTPSAGRAGGQLSSDGPRPRENEFATDSPLEDGFEPSVPLL